MDKRERVAKVLRALLPKEVDCSEECWSCERDAMDLAAAAIAAMEEPEEVTGSFDIGVWLRQELHNLSEVPPQLMKYWQEEPEPVSLVDDVARAILTASQSTYTGDEVLTPFQRQASAAISCLRENAEERLKKSSPAWKNEDAWIKQTIDAILGEEA